MVYVNAGFFDFQKRWQEDPVFTPEQYVSIARTWIDQGVRIIGGCCGTGPEFISRLAKKKSRAMGGHAGLEGSEVWG